ncbi:GntR family transcriptional regulator [Lacrimispora sp.]|uniref:GntR family transcriptional regulator n=1 Tax=Lacrimispora sp. TaxID=2719234 RepID=UPI0028A61724|nr:GntR family transcriptional regulator [Lacrimispora sp.]
MKTKNKYNDAIPLYSHIAEDLRLKILSEEWKPGDRIPAELVLCELYHVSRITIRKSIDELVRENLLFRERAKGTFVCDWEEEEEEHYTLVRSFTNEMKELGKEALTLKAEIHIYKADKKLSRYLNIDIGDPVMMLKRLRGTKGQAFAYFINYFTYRDEYPKDDASYFGSLYALLKKHGVIINQEKEYIEAVSPSKEVQDMLNVDKYQPILKRVRMTRQADSNFREYSECYYIGNQYRYYIDFGDVKWRE